MKEFEFVCGGIQPRSTDEDVCRVALDVQGKDRNVNLKISNISRSMVSGIPDLLLDALEIAAYVYCADQHASRGSTKLSKAGADWRRDMRFVIPVRCPDVWTQDELLEPLVETLSFLSDDHFVFDFVRAEAPVAQRELYFPALTDCSSEADAVALFSGGLDSLAGAVETVVKGGMRTVLVGHHSADKVFGVQRDLIWHLKHAGDRQRTLYVPVNVTNRRVTPPEKTQRTRSFLFASLAFALANMFGKDDFTFYENGVVSLNLPIAGDVLGARATRTTHPRVIRGFERIFSLLADRSITINTPFIWFTKRDVVERVVDAGFGHLLPKTVSCAHPRTWTREAYHCGVCSQCIDRRFAILAAGAGEFEPASDYAVDLLTGDRSRDEDARMVTAYVKSCRTISRSSNNGFASEYPEVISAWSDLPGLAAREAQGKIWELHRRHADNVLSVIAAGTVEHREALARGDLPARSLLSLCFSRERIEPTPALDITEQVARFMEQLSPSICEFAVDEHAGQIRFRGGVVLERADFKLIRVLLKGHRTAKARDEEVPFTTAEKISCALNVSEESVRQQVSRANKAAEPLAVDQGIILPGGLIEGARLQGYRLSPEAREISLADLNLSGRAVSQTPSLNVTESAKER